MPSTWGSKLEAKLSGLAETSSKETLQTLAKWIAFNRKRASDFKPVLLSRLGQGQQVIVLGILHEVFLTEKLNSTKWDRLQDLRVMLAEEVLWPTVENLGEAARSKMHDMLKEWDDANSFGGPTLLNQLRKKLEEAANSKEASTIDEEQEEQQQLPNKLPETEADNSETHKARENKLVATESPKAAVKLDTKVTPDQSFRSPSTKESTKADYDFERHGVPQSSVEPMSFLEPSRAIAQLQIARDLPHDGAVQLSAMFTALPAKVREACATAAEHDGTFAMDDGTAIDFAEQIQDNLLDMNMDEELKNVQALRDIIERQRVARQELIKLLIQSRCKFGADEAAKAYYESDLIKPQLAKRKQIIMDSMELEGLDIGEQDKVDDAEPEVELPPLSWYKAFEEASTPDTKRQKTS